jgi:hypothetical protein
MRLKSNIKFNHFLFCTVVIFLFISSCNLRNEACLDPLSTNFDVTGDDNCVDCCKFPSLNLSIVSILDFDSTYTILDTITNNLGYQLLVRDSRIYLYDFKMYDNIRLIPCENIIMDSLSGIEYADDFNILRAQDRSLTIGEYKYAGQLDSISFNVGLSQDLLSANFQKLANTHPFNSRNRLTDSLGVNSVANFTFRSIKDTIPIIINLTNIGLIVPLKSTKIEKNIKGESIQLTIYTHYDQLFKDINPKDNPQKIESILRQNISKFISVY